MDTGMQGSMTMGGTSSLAQASAWAVLRVADYQRARRFYTETLGLPIQDAPGEMAGGMGTVMTGSGTGFQLYENKALPAPQNTTLGLMVQDFDMTFQELKGRGVMFEEYDIPAMGIKTVGGVSEMQGVKSAWFKDSEGNIINLISDYTKMMK